MYLLLPLGLLSLFSIALLIIIYIIKPNYQNKKISSTYIWKYSLKYTKKERPKSKITNILIFILQFLILTLLALVISSPFIKSTKADTNYSIYILDSSYKMSASNDGETRFKRAVSEIIKSSDKDINSGKSITLIYAGVKTKVIVTKEKDLKTIKEKINSLTPSLGKVDMEDAIKTAGAMLKNDSAAKVYLYTNSSNINKDDKGVIDIINIANEDDWNIGVLDFTSELKEGYYTFNAKIGVYGLNKYTNAVLKVFNPNGNGGYQEFNKRINIFNNEEKNIEFTDIDIYSYDKVQIKLNPDDGVFDTMPYDDEKWIYDTKMSFKIQYSSFINSKFKHNNFIRGALITEKQMQKDFWSMQIDEPHELNDVKDYGYDLYIYEHYIPSYLPTDGAVLIINPTIGNTLSSEFSVDKLVDGTKDEFTLSRNVDHKILNGIGAQEIKAKSYKVLKNFKDNNYTSLMSINGDDVFIVKNEKDKKIAVLGINLNESNLVLNIAFPVLIHNIIGYFTPYPIRDIDIHSGDTKEISLRGKEVKLIYPDGRDVIKTDSDKFSFDMPGEYVLKETLLGTRENTLKFHVNLYPDESRINTNTITSENNFTVLRKKSPIDLYIYIAAILFTFIIIERTLYIIKNR